MFAGIDASGEIENSQTVEMEDEQIQENGIYKSNVYRTRFTLDNARARIPLIQDLVHKVWHILLSQTF